MSVNLQLREFLPEDSLVFDNASYDNSIVGVTADNRVVYDYNKMIVELMEDEGWSHDDAVDWIDYNTIRSLPYAGEKAPMIIYGLESYHE